MYILSMCHLGIGPLQFISVHPIIFGGPKGNFSRIRNRKLLIYIQLDLWPWISVESLWQPWQFVTGNAGHQRELSSKHIRVKMLFAALLPANERLSRPQQNRKRSLPHMVYLCQLSKLLFPTVEGNIPTFFKPTVAQWKTHKENPFYSQGI